MHAAHAGTAEERGGSMTTPTPPEDRDPYGPAPEPPPAGPWAPDSLPPDPLAGSAVPMERPPSIRLAVNLMYIGAALAAFRIVLILALIGEVRDQIREDDPSLTDSEVSSRVTGGVAVAIVFALIGVGLWLWMAHENGAGKSWARVVATVLAGLNIVSSLLLLAGSAMGVNILGLAYMVLAIVILVQLYRPDASAYYRARSA
jgi:hypothetical protein